MAVPISKTPREFIRRIVSEYLDDHFATIASLAQKYGKSQKNISDILHFAVQTPGITTLDIATSIANKVKNSTKNIAYTAQRWETALILRNRPAIEAELSEHREKLEELRSHYDSYDNYCTFEPHAPTKADILVSIRATQAAVRQLEKILAA